MNTVLHQGSVEAETKFFRFLLMLIAVRIECLKNSTDVSSFHIRLEFNELFLRLYRKICRRKICPENSKSFSFVGMSSISPSGAFSYAYGSSVGSGACGSEGASVSEFLDRNPAFLEAYLMKKWTLERLEQFLRKSLTPTLPETRLSLRPGTPISSPRLERCGTRFRRFI